MLTLRMMRIKLTKQVQTEDIEESLRHNEAGHWTMFKLSLEVFGECEEQGEG